MKTILISKSGSHKVDINKDESARVLILQIKNLIKPLVVDINLNGTNSNADIFNCFVGHQDIAQNLDIKINHNAHYTRANFCAKGIMKDHSKANFTGLIKVKRGSQNTDSFLEHRTLMLSDNAEISPIPSLQIDANEVRASHAATISNINEEDLFTLMSRGLNKLEAKNILIKSFLNDVIIKLPSNWQMKVLKLIS